MDYLEDNITIETLLQAEKQQATEKPKADPKLKTQKVFGTYETKINK